VAAFQDRAFTWRELLTERFDVDKVKGLSVHQTLYDLCQQKGVAAERNMFLLQGFDTSFSDILSKYRRK
jgi:hypothetical protein